VLTDENRFGLLGKAAVLSVTSLFDPEAPTIRGKYLLEKHSCGAATAPPANVPALEETNRTATSLGA